MSWSNLESPSQYSKTEVDQPFSVMPATGDSIIAPSRAALDDLIADVNVIEFDLSSAAGRCLVTRLLCALDRG